MGGVAGLLAGVPSRTDVVVAILGASAGLAGFVLVFLGLLISAYQAYPADTPKSVKESRRGAVWPVFGVFASSIVIIGLALLWLVIPGGTLFYWLLVGIFGADLGAIVVVAVITTVRLVK